MICKLCSEQSLLVKVSHVIPQWMYGLLPNCARNFKIVSPVEGEYKKRSQSGFYDSFVCKNCEDRFGLWDDSAAKVLRTRPVVTEDGIDFGQYEYGLLARFYLSVLWRMHASDGLMVSIDLGEDAEPLRQDLRNRDDSILNRYEIIPSWSNHVLSLGIAEPKLFAVDGAIYWKIYMPRFQALLNISGNPGSSRLAPWIMRAGNPLLMLEDTFEFGEAQIVLRALQANMERKNARRR